MPDGTGVFQDEKSRLYQTQIVNKMFSENETFVSHLDWPPKSSDINLFGILWDVLEKAFRNCFRVMTFLTVLISIHGHFLVPYRSISFFM